MRNYTMKLAQHINSRWLLTRLTDMVKVCTACQLCQCPGPLLLSLSCQDLIYCPLFGQSHHICADFASPGYLMGWNSFGWGARITFGGLQPPKPRPGYVPGYLFTILFRHFIYTCRPTNLYKHHLTNKCTALERHSNQRFSSLTSPCSRH